LIQFSVKSREYDPLLYSFRPLAWESMFLSSPHFPCAPCLLSNTHLDFCCPDFFTFAPFHVSEALLAEETQLPLRCNPSPSD
jgi:hypothetical protein